MHSLMVRFRAARVVLGGQVLFIKCSSAEVGGERRGQAE